MAILCYGEGSQGLVPPIVQKEPSPRSVNADHCDDYLHFSAFLYLWCKCLLFLLNIVHCQESLVEMGGSTN